MSEIIIFPQIESTNPATELMKLTLHELSTVRRSIHFFTEQYGKLDGWPYFQIVSVRDRLLVVIAYIRAYKAIYPTYRDLDETEQNLLDTLEIFDLRQYADNET